MPRFRRAICSVVPSALGLGLLFTPLRPAHAAGLDLDGWLARPDVSMVAVTFYDAESKAALANIPKWRRLLRKHRPDGLRLIVVAESKGGRCDQLPSRPDAVICDTGGLAKVYGASHSNGSSYLWSWRGRRVVDAGSVDDVARAVPKALARRPRVSLDATPELAKWLTKAVRSSVKVRIAAKPPEGGLPKPTGDCPARGVPERAIVSARLEGQKLDLGLESIRPRRCRLRRQRADWSASRGHRVMADALAALLDRARAPIDDHGAAAALQRPEPPVETPPPTSSAPSIGPGPSEPYSMDNAGDRARALRAFAESWEGVRYRRGQDSRTAIDNPAFGRRCYKELFGIDLGKTPTQIYRASGPPLAVDPDRAQDILQPGDLLFWTSHADRARGVMVYLGGGQMVHAADIRGVVIEEIPKPPYPQYLWLVAKRPLDVHPINK